MESMLSEGKTDDFSEERRKKLKTILHLLQEGSDSKKNEDNLCKIEEEKKKTDEENAKKAHEKQEMKEKGC